MHGPHASFESLTAAVAANVRGAPTPKLYMAIMFKPKRNETVSRGWKMKWWDNTSASPPQVTKFELSFDDVHSLVMEDFICRDEIGQEYVSGAMIRNNLYFLMFYEKHFPDGHTTYVSAGFILARIIGKSLYIDVICTEKPPPKPNPYANHKGSLLIELAIQHARRCKLEQVSLSALPNVLTYYPQFGFAHRMRCDKPPDMVIPNTLIALAKTRDDKYDPYKDDELIDFMTELQFNGYGTMYDKDCRTKGKTKKEVVKAMKEKKCGDNGFKMRLCLAPPPVPTPLASADASFKSAVSSLSSFKSVSPTSSRSSSSSMTSPKMSRDVVGKSKAKVASLSKVSTRLYAVGKSKAIAT
jgi:hypothetical protein